MSKKQADDLYDIYAKKLDFHSPLRRPKAVDDKGKPIYSKGFYEEFRIRVGEPKLRGTKTYRMPTMSLHFSVGDNIVSIFTDLDEYLTGPIAMNKIVAICEWFGLNRNSTAGWEILENKIAIHPHIGGGGAPCLGDFSQPWSVCVAQGNFPTLVNIAKSFLNNWTRNDAYWDINHRYRAWEDSKLLDWKTDIVLNTVINRFAYARDVSPQATTYRQVYHFTQSDTLSMLKSLGWSSREAYLWWGVASYCMSTRKDLPDGTLNDSYDATRKWIDFIDVTERWIAHKVGTGDMFRVSALMDGALTRNFDEQNPHNRRSHNSIFRSGEYSWVKQASQNNRDALRHLTRIDSDGYGVSINVILKAKKYFRRNKYMLIRREADLEQVCFRLGQDWYRNWDNGEHYRYNLWLAYYQRLIRYFRSTQKGKEVESQYHPVNGFMTSWEQMTIFTRHNKTDSDYNLMYGPFDTYYANIGLHILAIIDMVTLNTHLVINSNEQDDLYNKLKHMICADVFEGVQNQLRMKIRGIVDERDKSSRRAYGPRIKSNSGENQLSIETF